MAADLIPWTRYWRREGASVPLPASGFLSREMLDQAASTGAVSTLRDLRDVPCLMLLGEPGLGKTRLVQQEERDLTAALAPAGRSRYLDLGAYALEATLREALTQALSLEPASHVLHLFFDSLDDCHSRIPNLDRLLVQFLRDHRAQLGRLRLRIVSRTLDWPKGMGDDLRVLWGTDQVGVYHLLPLTQEDIRLAAEVANLDPDAFIEKIRGSRAESLAAAPLTLDFLTLTYRRTGSLRGTQAELFEQGCLCLLEESHRAGLVERSPLAAHDRLAIASRIGVMLLFCGRAAVHLAGASLESPGEDLQLIEVQGGHEEADGRKVDVTPEAVVGTLNSGLFVGVDGRRAVVQHRSFTEFLAARFLIKRKLKPEEALGYVTCRVGKDYIYVVPQLAPVALWLASLDKAILSRLIDIEPQVVLQSDPRLLEDDERAGLVTALLGQLESGERGELQPGLRPYLVRLQHPGLAEQLRSTIVDHAKPWLARAAAIEIAEACAEPDLQDSLVTVALGEDEDHDLRLLATRAIGAVGDEKHLRQLLPLAGGRAGDDPLDKLRAIALRTLRAKGLLHGDDLFACVTLPRHPHIIGSYALCLVQDLPESLEEADMSAALRWARGMSNQGDLPHSIGDLIQRILQHAVESPANVESDMAVIIANCIKSGTRLMLSIDGPRRRSVLEDVVQRVSGTSSELSALGRLLRPEDIAWIADRAADVTTEEDADKWFVLVRFVMRDGDSSSSDAVIRLADRNPLMRERFGRWVNPINLGSDEAKRSRADYRKSEELAIDRTGSQMGPASPGEVDERLVLTLDRQDPERFSALLRLLELQNGGGGPGLLHGADPEALTGWQRLGDDERKRVRSAASTYVKTVAPTRTDWEEGITPMAADGYRALVLLGTDPKALEDLPKGVWTAWSPVILRLSPLGLASSQAHLRVLQEAASVARDAFAEAVQELVTQVRGRGRDVTELLVLKSCWNERLGQVLLDLARDKETQGQTLRGVLGVLLERGHRGALELAVWELKRCRSKGHASRSTAAGSALLLKGNGRAWDATIRAMYEQPGWGMKLMDSLFQVTSHHDIAVPADLTEEALADLYLWLVQYFPRSHNPKVEGPHIVSPRARIGEFRDRILMNLQAKGTEASPKTSVFSTRVSRMSRSVARGIISRPGPGSP